MLEINNISKKYKQLTAVNRISFNVRDGEFYGLLGPNGAGKTTTINMISAILPPDEGNILADGKNIYQFKDEVKMKMGIVPQEIALYDEMHALDNLLFWGSLYQVKGIKAKQKAENLLEWVGLADRKKDMIKTYSGGMKRRINIASALMHDPSLLIMDEPTVGIDPQSRNKIYELLDELHKEGKTILYTTHYMAEAERLCDRIGIIDKGNLIAEGSLDELKKQNQMEEIVVITYNNEFLTPEFNGYKMEHDPEKKAIIISTRNLNSDLPLIVKHCADTNIQIQNIDIRSINLETIFLHLTGRQLRD